MLIAQNTMAVVAALGLLILVTIGIMYICDKIISWCEYSQENKIKALTSLMIVTCLSLVLALSL